MHTVIRLDLISFYYFFGGKSFSSTEQGDQRFWEPVLCASATSGSSIRQVLNFRDTMLKKKKKKEMNENENAFAHVHLLLIAPVFFVLFFLVLFFCVFKDVEHLLDLESYSYSPAHPFVAVYPSAHGSTV